MMRRGVTLESNARGEDDYVNTSIYRGDSMLSRGNERCTLNSGSRGREEEPREAQIPATSTTINAVTTDIINYSNSHIHE
jgi:hypothetical protein